MNLCKILAISCFLHVTAYGQVSQKPSIIFKEFKATSSGSVQSHKDKLYDLTLNDIINLKKFTIINRSPEVWSAIEAEFAMQDFIDPTSALSLGTLSGAHYLIEGYLSSFTSERHFTTTTDQKVDYYFTTTAHATLKIVNLSSGEYEQSVSSEISINNAEQDKSIQLALRKLATELVNGLNKKILLKGTVLSLTPPHTVKLSLGEEDGVKIQDTYSIFHNSHMVAKIKITELSSYSSVGRIVGGNYKEINILDSAKESASTASNTVMVESKEKQKVLVNAGADIGLKQGHIFAVTQTAERKIGDKVVEEQKEIGHVYIKEVKDSYAIGKIIGGYNSITRGTVLTESKEPMSTAKGFVQLAYKFSLATSINPSLPQGVVTVENGSGSYDINTAYLQEFNDIQNIHVYSIGMGSRNLVKDLSTTLYIDFYNAKHVSNWIPRLNILYDHAFVPEKLFLAVGGSIGYGRMKQSVPSNVISTISKGESSELESYSIMFAGEVGLRYRLKKICLGMGLSYDYINFNNWSYHIDVEGSKKETAPDSIIPYPKLNLSGVYSNITLSYTFN